MEREVGTLIRWDDENGHGFIRPHNEKDDIFLHVSAVAHYQRRPHLNDVLSYEVALDEKQRYYACSAKIEGIAWSRFTLIWWSCLLLVFGTYLFFIFRQRLPFHPLAVYVLMSFFALWAYHRDQWGAQLAEWRGRDLRLHLWEALGGWPGALVAQRLYRHNLRRLSYQLVFWGIVAGHGVLWYHVLTHYEMYHAYQQAVTTRVQVVIKGIQGETQRLTSRNTQESETTAPQTGPRSPTTPPKNARVVEGIVKEIRPDEGVVVSLSSEEGSDGILDKSTLAADFFTRFTPGERIRVAIHTIRIEGEEKRIELILVED